MQGGRFDFTSSLYLDLRHASSSLRGWASLTTGVPAALREPPDPRRVAAAVADLQGCEAGTSYPSTLHLFWDLLGFLGAGRAPAVIVDRGAYPVARWAASQLARAGRPAQVIPHHDGGAASRAAGNAARRGFRPVLLTDGVCPGCGRTAPLGAYLDAVRPHGGRLVIDDTQSLGILGHDPEGHPPYGTGGGGSLRRSGVGGPDVVVGASLAKAFGAPVAVLSGSGSCVRRLARGGATRTHSSPASAADVQAASRALEMNDDHGDALRQRLARCVLAFRSALQEHGIRTTGRSFPVQSIRGVGGASAEALHSRLRGAGIRAVLHRRGARREAAVSFLITTRHDPDDMAEVAARVARVATPILRSSNAGRSPCAAS